MAQIRRETFVEASHLTKLLIQTGRYVQESELNEMQDNLRVHAYRALSAISRNAVAVDTGLRAVAGGVNTITFEAGQFLMDGIYGGFTSNIVVTGLTTPGAPRTDRFYVEMKEVEVADPLPDATLGETSRRRQLQYEVKVAEGGSTPASTGDPWTGGTWRMEIGYIIRGSGIAAITYTDFVHTFKLLPGQIAKQITNTVDGKVERLYAGTACTVEGQTANVPLKLKDAVIQDTDINLSDVAGTVDASNAGRRLLGAGGIPNDAVSLLRMVNGRAMVTVGNGSNTFGDVNGATAVTAVLATIWAAAPGLAVTLFVKGGTYTVGAGATITLGGPLRIVGEAPPAGGSAACTFSGATQAMFQIDYAFEIENVHLANTSATHLLLSNGAPVSIRRCILEAGIRVVDYISTEESPITIVDTRIRAAAVASQYPPVTLENTGNTFGHVVIERCVLDANRRKVPCIRLDASDVDCPFMGVVVRDSILITGSHGATTPVVNTGMFAFGDTAANSVYLDSIVFDNCTVETDVTGAEGGVALRLRVGVAASDDAADSDSWIRQAQFRNCRFRLNQSNRASGLGFFSLRQRDFSSTAIDAMSQIVFDSCVWDLLARTIGEEAADSATHDRAAVWIEGNRVELRNCVVRGVVDKLWDAAASGATNWSSIVTVNSATQNLTAYGQQTGSVLVDGLAVQRLSIGAGGSGLAATSALYVGTNLQTVATIRRVTFDSQTLSADPFAVGAVGVVYAFGGGSAVIEDCDIRLKTTTVAPGIHVRRGSKTVCRCRIQGGTVGITYGSTSASDIVTVTECHVASAGTGIGLTGVDIDGSLHVNNCYATNCSFAGISLSTKHSTCRDNYAIGNDTSNGSVSDRIQIQFGVNVLTSVVHGNKAESSAGNRSNIDAPVASPTGPAHIGWQTTNTTALNGVSTDFETMWFNDAIKR
jgi:hypothetical protein